MSVLFIHANDSEFHSRDDGAEYDRPEAAMMAGVRSAVAMASEEIVQGRPSAAIEVIIERDNGSQVLRSIVAISVSPLMTADATIVPFPLQR